MTQQLNLLDQAKQGDVEAIATLINKQLQPKGITVRTNLTQGCLTVIAESSDAPEQASLVDFIRKGIINLKVEAIKRVIVQGRITGKTSSVWRESFDMQSATTPATKQPALTSSSLLAQDKSKLDLSKNGKLIAILSIVKGQKKLIDTILLLGILLVLTVNLFAVDKSRPTLWEYRVESINDDAFDLAMASMGADGWELASARRAISGESSSNHGLYEVILKRPATEARAREINKNAEAEIKQTHLRALQSQAKMEISSVNFAQQSAYVEKVAFNTTAEQLGSSFKPETDDYTYNLTGDASKAAITATSKTDGIKSYVGAVFAVQKGSEVNTVAVVCESDSPSKIPPAPPQLNGNEPACPAGSSKL